MFSLVGALICSSRMLITQFLVVLSALESGFRLSHVGGDVSAKATGAVKMTVVNSRIPVIIFLSFLFAVVFIENALNERSDEKCSHGDRKTDNGEFNDVFSFSNLLFLSAGGEEHHAADDNGKECERTDGHRKNVDEANNVRSDGYRRALALF